MIVQYFSHHEGKLVNSYHTSPEHEQEILCDYYETQGLGRDPLEILIEEETLQENDYVNRKSTRG